MSKTKWFSGPPPSVGWWPASAFRNDDVLRWWDGKKWSIGVRTCRSAQYAARKAAEQGTLSTMIEWTHRPKNWPKRSYT